MKIFSAFLAITATINVHSSLIGIMDSGTDLSHKDLKAKAYVNLKEKKGHEDLDGDGLAGDVYGWDFTRNIPYPFDPTYNNLITNKVKNFYKLIAKFETKTITPDEIKYLQEAAKDEQLMNQVNFIGSYIHGTHVAGISVKNVPDAKVLAFKILPTVYNVTPAKSPPPVKIQIPESVGEFKVMLSNEALDEINTLKKINKIFGLKKADVVNQSFGISFENALKMVFKRYVMYFGEAPSKDVLVDLLRSYYTILSMKGPEAYSVSPNTLFLVAAGNESSDNDSYPEFPSLVNVENKLVVAATVGYEKLADFSNTGATVVDVAAPGVAILSTAPADNYISLSGTSQATPFVTNVVAAMKDANPTLNVSDVKKIIMNTVDKKAWLVAKVKSAGIVNRERAILAANLSTSIGVDASILKAKSQIADVAIPTRVSGEGFIDIPSKIEGLNFRPHLPSLIEIE